MQKSTFTRTVVAGGVAGLGLTLGGVALATADPGAGDRDGRDHPGMVRHGGPELAEELGVSEDRLADALESVHDELRSERPDLADGGRPTPPSEEQRDARARAFAEALAAELGVDVAEVTAALDAVRDAHTADAREALAERLDAAVDDGALTAADKASVLKAYDAGVLRGPGGGGHRGPDGHGGPRG